MSKVEFKRVLVLSTGNKIYVLDDTSLVPEQAVLFVATAADETSAGYSDLIDTFTGSSKYGDENSSYTVTHYRTIGGVKTKTFEAVVTGFDTGEIYVNVSTCTENTYLNYVVFGS